ncbi:MAG: prepilin-type N-terminal cleavage/methylation domain-containing protein [Lachnospiraceae bacterium]|nr:prepilin-type N-terminal cleavage/methylation domain-containing protein [Lachnospiraceae bacterium]
MRNKRRKDNRYGFTLVEMMVVIMVMAIMMGATMWGVTGWIDHFTYIRNEETARYIYLGAQSGLSAYASRGSLEELMDRVEAQAGAAKVFTTSTEKTKYGLPDNTDNHDKQHKYATLKADKGTLRDNSIPESKLLYEIIGPYLSDTETLDGSVAVEFDLTAGKVYSVFYSSWASLYAYNENIEATSVWGPYEINPASRAETMRRDYSIGYYAADQVNVAQIEDSGFSWEVEEAMLYNEELLHLDFRSDSDSYEYHTAYTLTFYKKTDSGDQEVFSVKMDPMEDMFKQEWLDKGIDPTAFDPDTPPDPVEYRRAKLQAKLAGESDYSDCYFYVGYQPSRVAGNTDKLNVTLMLDATMNSNTYARLNTKDSSGNELTEGRTDRTGLSITRFLGDDPALIFATVEVEPSAGAGGALSGLHAESKDSNIENDLFATDKDDLGAVQPLQRGSYGVLYPRHLSNIRFGESSKKRLEDAGETKKDYTYTLKDHIDMEKALQYQVLTPDGQKIAADKLFFASIPELSEESTLNGDGYTIFDLKMDNSSNITFAASDRDTDGSIKTGSTNKAESIGIVDENKGKIRRLILSGAKLSVLTKAQADADGVSESADGAIFSDTLRAAGILCGRDEGSIEEVYLDDTCESEATLVQDPSPDKQKGCGVGMVGGVLTLKAKQDGKALQSHDRIRAGGQLKGYIRGTETVPDYSESAEREKLNETYADTYAYGVGGIFGYVSGDLTKTGEANVALASQSALGLSQNAVIDKLLKSEEDGYLKMEKAEKAVDGTISTVSGNDPVFYVKGSGVSSAEQLKADSKLDLRSVVSYVDINEKTGGSKNDMVGGIVGNIWVKTGKTAAQTGDIAIPKTEIAPRIVGCENYGNVFGRDMVGGIVGFSGKSAYISECVDYGEVGASKGIAGGISAENFGYLESCYVDRFKDDSKTYLPLIEGNENAAGAVTCINHEKAIVKDCGCALLHKDQSGLEDTERITIKGNSMDIFGYLIGENEGMLDGGLVGPYVAYETLRNDIVIGGGAGVNYSTGTVKNFESTMDMKMGSAAILGGVAGKNHGDIKDCIFSGSIDQKTNGRSIKELRIGGIVAVNAKETGKTKQPVIKDCNLVGASILARGVCTLSESDTEAQKLDKSSRIGGVCASNEAGALIKDCHLTAHFKTENGGFVGNTSNQPIIDRRTEFSVVNGMAGGIAAVNIGRVQHCGYTDRLILLREDLAKTQAGEKPFHRFMTLSAAPSNPTKDMAFADEAIRYMEIASEEEGNKEYSEDYKAGTDWAAARDTLRSKVESFAESKIDIDAGKRVRAKEISAAAAEMLRRKFMKGLTDELNDQPEKDSSISAASACGYLAGYWSDPVNTCASLPKEADATGLPAYDIGDNRCRITMDTGKGYLGGIVGYNSKSGEVEYCSTGRWVVESYLPTSTISAIGGIAGENAADGRKFRYNLNLAYIRRELPCDLDVDLYASNAMTDEPDPVFDAHAFHYVGGVIGTQSNVTKDGWVIEGCANAGYVANLYGNNVGGVIAKMRKNGGTVQYCYNYGTLMCGFADNKNGIGGYVGTAGGIMSHLTEMNFDQSVSVISCQNHGVVNLPIRGISADRKTLVSNWGRMSANDVGGIVGQLSSPKNDRYYVLNMEDCVNGVGAEIYTHSACAAILCRVGGVSDYSATNRKESKTIAETENNAVVNLISCRNYSDDIYAFNDRMAVGNKRVLDNKEGSIFASKPEITKASRAGYLAVQNCLTVRVGDYTSNGYTTADCKIFSRDDVKKSSKHPEWGRGLEYCSDNYVIDNLSFQYLPSSEDVSRNQERLVTIPGVTNQKVISLRQLSRVNAAKPSSGIQSTGELGDSLAEEYVAGGSLRTYYTNFAKTIDSEPEAAVQRLFAVSVDENDETYALIAEEDGGMVRSANTENAWIGKDSQRKNRDALFLQVNPVGDADLVGPVIHTFSEKDMDRNITKMDDAQHYSYSNKYEAGTYEKSRLPIADEFDWDEDGYYQLDRDYIEHADYVKSIRGWDNVDDVNVKEDTESGRYKISWKPVERNNKPVTATRYQMKISVYSLPSEETFDADDFNGNSDLPTYYRLEKETEQVVTSRTTTIDAPTLPEYESGRKYYLVVRARDYRALRDTTAANYATLGFSDVEDEGDGEDDIRSYAVLLEKLPSPEFEIVEYGGLWRLHLLNPDVFMPYIEKGANIRVGAYLLNNLGKKNTATEVAIAADSIEYKSTDTNLLNNISDTYIDDKNFAKGQQDLEIQTFATATGYLSADVQTMTVYVPQKAHPNTLITATVTTEVLTGKDPQYEAILTYDQFDDTITPPIPQYILLELYRIRTEGGKTWQETVARQDVMLEVGQSQKVDIGSYYVPASVKKEFKDTDTFGVAYWYANSGQGDVNTYFETTQKWAVESGVPKDRSTGYITDISTGTTKYYFHTVKELVEPEIEIVHLTRGAPGNANSAGGWWARLVNPEDYADAPGAQIEVRVRNATKPTDYVTTVFSAKDKVSGHENLDFYGGSIDGKLNSNVIVEARAVGEESFASDFVIFGEGTSRGAVNLKKNLGNDTGVDMSPITGDSMKLGADGKLTYTGTLHTPSVNDANQPQYVSVELFAKDSADGEYKTLYLDLDHQLQPGNNDLDMSFTLTPDTSKNLGDLSRFYDFHLTAWYSAMNYPNTNTRKLTQYFKTTEEVAQANGYDRSEGILTYVGLDENIRSVSENAVYYYAAPLKDHAYYNNKELRRDSGATIAKVLSATADDTTHKATWTVNSDISDTNKYNVKETFIQVPKNTAVASAEDLLAGVGSVSGNTIVAEGVTEDVAAKEVTGALPPSGWYTGGFTGSYDAVNYDYYIVMQIYDSDLAAADGTPANDGYLTAYGASTYMRMPLKLTTPIVEFCKLSKNDREWYVRLVNADKFTGLNATITVTLEGTNHHEEYVLSNMDVLGLGLTNEWGYRFETEAKGNKNPGTAQYWKKSAVATAPGFEDSDVYDYDKTTNLAMRLKSSLDSVETKVDMDSIDNEILTRSPGAIDYTGHLHTKSHPNNNGEEPQYITVEMFGTDASGKVVTLYLEADKKLPDKKSANYLYDVEIPIHLTDENTGLHLDDYTDIHVACWYSGMAFPKHVAGHYLHTWFKTNEAVDDAIATRANGFIKLIAKNYSATGGTQEGGTPSAPVYFYAAPLAKDEFKATNVLYLETTPTVTP